MTDSKYSKLIDMLDYITPQNDIWDFGVPMGDQMSSCVYGNGYYVWFYNESNSNLIYWTDNIKNTRRYIGIPLGYCRGVVFDGSKFVVIALSGNNIIIYYFNNPESTISTGSTTYLSGSGPSVISFVYTGNKYMFKYSHGSTTASFLCHTSNVSTPFTVGSIGLGRGNVFYLNGYYMSVVNTGYDRYKSNIYYSTDLNIWTEGIQVARKGSMDDTEILACWKDTKYHFIIATTNNTNDTIYMTSNGILSSDSATLVGYFSFKIVGVTNFFPVQVQDNVILFVHSGSLYFSFTNDVLNTQKVIFKKSDMTIFAISFNKNLIFCCGKYLATCPFGYKVLPIVDGGQSLPMIRAKE